MHTHIGIWAVITLIVMELSSVEGTKCHEVRKRFLRF